MWPYLQRWIGELLIDIGQRLVRSSRERASYVAIRRNSGRNRYEW